MSNLSRRDFAMTAGLAAAASDRKEITAMVLKFLKEFGF